MQPWYRRALAKGRTPIPDSPGARPWLNQESPSSAFEGQTQQGSRAKDGDKPSTNIAVQNAEPAPTTATAKATSCTDQSYRFWTESDLRRLVEMRNGGAKWSAIASEFPDRTFEALKQTYHKRRHTVEQKMSGEEDNVAATNEEQKDLV
ncbi:hypothetical protein FGADI_2068 [Fusarium gaditjirri]|uniref:Myb-like domain-containing protein n=1 Tax=Fusarium gaditjirri TaxID=282569 RepID=A0A8H4TJ62_9HYPO|nr:hypothetical protein FGADI_2068 [Fusarium gaditjirri]